MQYVIYTVILLIFLIAIASGIVALIERRRPKEKKSSGWKRLLVSFLIVLFLIIIVGAIYFGIYYRGDSTAKKSLESGEIVSVVELNNGYFFDGPSEEQALIFYPGAKVEAGAYAPLMYERAEQWGDCFFVKMPLNMAILDYEAADSIRNEYHYSRWYIAGHSLGGTSAALYASEHETDLNGLFLLAAYSTKPLENDIMTCSIYGDQDLVLNKKEYENNRENLPAGSAEVIISGGNHAQYGSYGKQRGDGEATISAEQQREEVVQAIKAQTATE